MIVDKQALSNWVELKNKLARVKVEEMYARTEICEELALNLSSGIHNFDIDGSKVKVTNKVTITLDQEIYLEIKDQLPDEETDLVMIKYALKMKEYKLYGETGSIQLDQAITIKPATPTLEVKYGN